MLENLVRKACKQEVACKGCFTCDTLRHVNFRKSTLEEVDCLDLFQSSFKQGFGTEIALVAWTDDLHQRLHRGECTPFDPAGSLRGFPDPQSWYPSGSTGVLEFGGTVLQ